MTTEPAVDVLCPKCGGKTWDNRETKTNPKAPDFKCRDRACDGVIWPPKNGKATAPAARPAARTPQPTNIGGPLPYEPQETGAPPAAYVPAAVLNADAALDAQFKLYSRCLDRAFSEGNRVGLDKLGGDIAGAVVALAATLYIQASKK